jgi:L-serine dehydratase
MFLSVFDIFKIGVGPSSSHTMGPMTAAARFLGDLRGGREKEPGAGELGGLACSLHGSLAFTGKGHATDRAVILGLSGFEPATLDPTGRRCWRRRCGPPASSRRPGFRR